MNQSKNTLQASKLGLKLILALFLFLGLVLTAHAATHPLTNRAETGKGWAWGSTGTFGGIVTGIGWIDMSPASSNSLTYDDTTYDLRGYVWSSTYGWVRFANWGSCPASGAPCDPSIDEVRAEITGWARVCSVYVANCGGALKPASVLGGWDGWISLGNRNEGAGQDPRTAGNYGWILDRFGEVSGYAWGGGGSSGLVGWVLAADLNLGVALPPVVDLVGKVDGVDQPADTFYLRYDEELDVRWTLDPSPEGTTVCNASASPAPASFASPAAPVSTVANYAVADPAAGDTATYTLSCTNDGGGPRSDTVTVTTPAPPVVSYFEARTNGGTPFNWPDFPNNGTGPAPDNYPIFRLHDTDASTQVRWDVPGITTAPEYDPAVDGCTGEDFSTGPSRPVSQTITMDPYLPAVGAWEDYVLRCKGPGGEIASGMIIQNPAPDVQLNIDKDFVAISDDASYTDDEVELSWDIFGWDPGTCRITGPSYTLDPLPGLTGNVSVEIKGESEFTLFCDRTGVEFNFNNEDSETVQISGIYTED